MWSGNGFEEQEARLEEKVKSCLGKKGTDSDPTFDPTDEVRTEGDVPLKKCNSSRLCIPARTRLGYPPVPP